MIKRIQLFEVELSWIETLQIREKSADTTIIQPEKYFAVIISCDIAIISLDWIASKYEKVKWAIKIYINEKIEKI